MKATTETRLCTQNRELSWLRFNERVLDEATDETVPLLERLGFVSIFASNLDEFFMIRVGSLLDLMHLKEYSIDNKSGMTPREQLEKIYEAVRPLYEKQESIYFSLEQQLQEKGISHLTYDKLSKSERKFVEQYYRTSVEPILSPQIVDQHHPFPHLQNKLLHVGAKLRYKGKSMFALVPVPATLPPLLFLPGDGVRYLFVEDMIKRYLQELFGDYQVVEHATVCVTRNADVNLDDEAYDDDVDFRKKMRNVLRQRKRLMPVRLELSCAVGHSFQKYLGTALGLEETQIFVTKVPMKLGFVSTIAERLPAEKKKALVYRTFTPQPCPMLRYDKSILHQVRARDVLLSYPYESMEPFLALLREAAGAPETISIKITIYRLARQAKLIEYLCTAAENGKEVTVVIELRARFDEQNNIDWSERLEEAGCTVIYGIENYKVHSKICLITRREHGRIAYITQVGTGNYNEKTAKLYTDLSLITGKQEIGQDAVAFFQNMAIGNLYGEYRYLLVSPVSLKEQVLRMIAQEAQRGDEGRIVLKLNSITDIDIIEQLIQASCAGVHICMIVRGICCIRPGIPGKTENITIINVVGRFLEHSRVYCFGSGENEKIYISSADMMTRNTERRVEVACPIYDDAVRAKIHHILDAVEYDTEKARAMQPDGTYVRREHNTTPLDSQLALMQDAERAAKEAAENQPRERFHWLKRLFRSTP